jgi:hypothetical protein
MCFFQYILPSLLTREATFSYKQPHDHPPKREREKQRKKERKGKRDTARKRKRKSVGGEGAVGLFFICFVSCVSLVLF